MAFTAFSLIVSTGILIFIHAAASLGAESTTHFQHTFQLESTNSRGVIRLGSPWIDFSPSSCAFTCMYKYRNCRSFMFNPSSKLCTPGSFINSNQAVPSASEGNLYHSFFCDSSKGFSIQRVGTTSACVGVFEPGTYKEADEGCKNKGAYLMSVKTIDKINILKLIWGSSNTWVGCDDIANEGTFIWKVDGEELTDSERYTLFSNGEPNDYEKNEDCVSLAHGDNKLNDYNCEFNHTYACEIPI